MTRLLWGFYTLAFMILVGSETAWGTVKSERSRPQDSQWIEPVEAERARSEMQLRSLMQLAGSKKANVEVVFKKLEELQSQKRSQ